MNQVVTTQVPFLRGAKTTVPEGLTLAQIVQLQDLPAFFGSDGVVYVGEQEVPRALWSAAKPKSGQIIRIFCRLKGGQAKSFLGLFAAIAVAAVATIISGGALLPFLGGAFAAGHIGAILGGAAVSILGSMAVGALFGQGQQTPQTNGDTGGEPNSASLSGNILAPDGRLPRSIGTNIVFPPFISRPLSEVSGDDLYVEGVVALAGPHAWLEYRSGNTNIAGMTDIEIDSRPGLPGDTAPTLVQRYGWEVANPIELSKLAIDPENPTRVLHQSDPWRDLPTWHRIVTRKAPDEIWLTYEMAEGLWDDDDPTEDMYLPLRLRMRRRGATSWVNLPELMISSRRNKLYRFMVKIMWATAPTLPTPPTQNGIVRAYKDVPAAQLPTVVTPGGWLAHSHFSGGAGIDNVANVACYTDRAEIFLTEATFPKDVYEIEMMRGTPVSDINLSNYEITVGITDNPDLFGFRLNGSTYEFYQGQEGRHQRMVLAYYASVKNTNPVSSPGTDAVCAIRVKNRRIDQFSALVSGYTYDWNGIEWSDLSTTGNPAPHLVQLYTDTKLSPYAIPSDMMDNTSILAWRAFCASANLECNYVAEQDSWEDVKTAILTAGQALSKGFDTVGVAYEHDRSAESPIHAITPVNSNGDEWQLPFDTRPDALIVSFRDEDDDYNDQQIIVYDDNVAEEDARLFTSIRYNNITSRQQAADQALKDLRKQRLRAQIHNRTVPAEGLQLEIGDLVAVQDEVLTRVAGHTRIKSITRNAVSHPGGFEIISLTLDSEIPVVNEDEVFDAPDVWDVPNVWNLGIQTGIAIKSTRGTIVTKGLSDATGYLESITLVSPLEPPTGDIAVGDMIWSGPITEEHKRMLVLGITPPNQDLEFGVLLVDEAPAINDPTPDVIDEEEEVVPGELAFDSYFGLYSTDKSSATNDVDFDPLVDLGAEVGDFVMVFCTSGAFTSAIPTTDPPTDWTVVFNGATVNNYQRVYGRKITGAEVSRRFLDNVADYNLIACLFKGTIGTPTYSTASGEQSNGDISPQSIALSGGTLPAISWAFGTYVDNGAGGNIQAPVTLTLRETGVDVDDENITLPVGAGARLKIKVDNLAQSNKTADMGDEGTSGWMSSGYVTLS